MSEHKAGPPAKLKPQQPMSTEDIQKAFAQARPRPSRKRSIEIFEIADDAASTNYQQNDLPMNKKRPLVQTFQATNTLSTILPSIQNSKQNGAKLFTGNLQKDSRARLTLAQGGASIEKLHIVLNIEEKPYLAARSLNQQTKKQSKPRQEQTPQRLPLQVDHRTPQVPNFTIDRAGAPTGKENDLPASRIATPKSTRAQTPRIRNVVKKHPLTTSGKVQRSRPRFDVPVSQAHASTPNQALPKLEGSPLTKLQNYSGKNAIIGPDTEPKIWEAHDRISKLRRVPLGSHEKRSLDGAGKTVSASDGVVLDRQVVKKPSGMVYGVPLQSHETRLPISMLFNPPRFARTDNAPLQVKQAVTVPAGGLARDFAFLPMLYSRLELSDEELVSTMLAFLTTRILSPDYDLREVALLLKTLQRLFLQIAGTKERFDVLGDIVSNRFCTYLENRYPNKRQPW